MFNFFCKILQHPKINHGSAPDKDLTIDIIMFVESNNLITDQKSLAETFNHYFVNISNLSINIIDDKSGKGDISNHSSIISIKQHI